MTEQQKASTSVIPDRARLNQTSNASYSSDSPKFQHSGQGNPCPLCHRTKDGDCRWNDEVVLCHTHAERDAQVPGYVYRGPKDIWGQYFPAPPPKPVRDKARKEFIYRDKQGNLLVKVTRTDDGTGKKRIYQSHWDGRQWMKGLTPDVKKRLRLYRIDDPINQSAIAAGKPIVLAEGEGKADLLLGLGVAATSAIGGAGKWRHYGYPNYLEDLAGAMVVLCPDRDEPGVKHCLDIEQDFPNAQWLYAFPDSPLWDSLSEKNGLDIADWVAQEGVGAEQILGAICPKRPQLKLSTPPAATAEEPEKKTLAQLLLEVADQGSYFHTPAQRAYVDIPVNGVRQTFPVRHKTFKQWLLRELFNRYGRTAGSETLNQVLGVLESRACFDGEEQEVYLRLAELGGNVYIDLGTADWEAVEVSVEGWRMVSNPPVRFRRPSTVLALPTPEPGGTLDELRSLLNIDESGWILVVCWLLFCFYPKHPHPILVLHGEQGTGKSYTARLLKGLIDPGKAPLIPNVAALRDLAIAAENRWMLAYDNISFLSADKSDALCRISTGGGFSTRTLYENDEETVFEFIRPQILTGIDSLASRGDLLERSLLVQLLTIPEEDRLTEEELDTQLDRLRGRIFGALLTALGQTLERLPTVQVGRLPRMADFAKFAIAAESALGLPEGSFVRVYGGNRQEAHETVVDSSPVALALQRLMEHRQRWQGSASELLQELEKLVDEKTTKGKDWAGNPKILGKKLIRLAPDLRAMGLMITPDRKNSKRFYYIERVDIHTSPTSPTSQAPQKGRSSGDKDAPANVTQEAVNVTGDDSDPTQPLTSPQPDPNVTGQGAATWGFSQTGDNSDKRDETEALLSRWLNKTVRKRGKVGWRGQVKAVQDTMAEVLWHGDQQPSLVPLADLEEVA